MNYRTIIVAAAVLLALGLVWLRFKPVKLAAGYYSVDGETYFSDGEGTVCGPRWEEADGPKTALASLPWGHVTGCKPTEGALSMGWYTSGGNYYLASGRASACQYASADFFELAVPGSATPLPTVPAEIASAAPCVVTPRVIDEGFVLYRGALYRSDGKGHLCSYESYDHYASAGGRNGTWETVNRVPHTSSVDGVCPTK
jgi:hypothetical protein